MFEEYIVRDTGGSPPINSHFPRIFLLHLDGPWATRLFLESASMEASHVEPERCEPVISIGFLPSQVLTRTISTF
jgi:hypothetical protein